MSLLDLVLETLRSLTANKARSALTILGIVVGIGSVIVLVSIGQGTQTSIQEQMQSAGTNLVTIANTAQASGGGEGLTRADLAALAELSGVKMATPVRTGSFDVVYGGESNSSQVIGVEPRYQEARSIKIGAGRFITAYQQDIAAHVAVISDGLLSELWGSGTNARDALGSQIRIGGVIFTVVGVTANSGGGALGMVGDTTVYVPISAAGAALTGEGAYSTIYLVGASQEVMSQITAQAETLLKARHGYSASEDGDFTIMDMSSMLEMASTVTSTLTGMLAAISSISLVVGGIGIMNMMLTSVTERIREIGLRKAIGATPGNITLQFLIESVGLTSLGGLIGVGLGMAIAALVNLSGVVSTTVTSGSVLLSVGVCMLIGILFGYWPARRAAKLDPIEALRYQ